MEGYGDPGEGPKLGGGFIQWQRREFLFSALTSYHVVVDEFPTAIQETERLQALPLRIDFLAVDVMTRDDNINAEHVNRHKLYYDYIPWRPKGCFLF